MVPSPSPRKRRSSSRAGLLASGLGDGAGSCEIASCSPAGLPALGPVPPHPHRDRGSAAHRHSPAREEAGSAAASPLRAARGGASGWREGGTEEPGWAGLPAATGSDRGSEAGGGSLPPFPASPLPGLGKRRAENGRPGPPLGSGGGHGDRHKPRVACLGKHPRSGPGRAKAAPLAAGGAERACGLGSVQSVPSTAGRRFWARAA